MTMPAGPASPSVDARAIAQAAALVPRQDSNTSLVPDHVWQAADALYMRFATPVPIDDIFIEGIEGVAFKRPSLDGTDAIIAIEAIQCPILPGATSPPPLLLAMRLLNSVLRLNLLPQNCLTAKPGLDDFCFGLAWWFDFEFDAMRVASAGDKDRVSAGCRWTAKIACTGKVFICRRWDRHQFCDIGRGVGDNAAGSGRRLAGGFNFKARYFCR